MFLEAVTSVIQEPTGNVLKWESDGFFKIGEDNWKDIEIEAIFKYKGGSIGVFPRFLTPFTYMYFSIGKTVFQTDKELGLEEEKNMAIFSLALGDREVELGAKELKSPLVIGQTYTIRAVVEKNNYRIFVNDELFFNIDHNGTTTGNACVYATKGNECDDITISARFPDQWTSNLDTAADGALIFNSEAADEDKFIAMDNPVAATSDLYIEQLVETGTDKQFVFHADYKGSCSIALRQMNGTEKDKEVRVSGAEMKSWTKLIGKAKVAVDCTQVALRFYVAPGKNAVINNAQVEPGVNETSYIPNDLLDKPATRASSILSFPAQGVLDPAVGTISLWVKPHVNYTATPTENYMLLQHGDMASGINLFGVGGNLSIKHGNTLLTAPNVFNQKDTWKHLVISWNYAELCLYVDGVKKEMKSSGLSTVEADILFIGNDPSGTHQVFNGLIDDLIIYKTVMDEDDVLEQFQAETAPMDSADMSFRATFNHAIGNFQKAYAEIPNAPAYGSPILAEKQSGGVLRKVSFLDFESGEYVTWNKEYLPYYGEDYIQTSFDDLDTTSFKVNVTDREGNFIGEPYSVKGKRIYLTLTDEEKEKYKYQTLVAQYQLNDSYTVDFNIPAADSFRVDIAKHDGDQIDITYEGNRFTQEKLADMIEMNPMLNPNHQGFLYVTQNNLPVVSFKIKITPPDVPADGLSECLIIVEPVDENGNHVCEAKLSITAEHGTIYPHLEMESVRLRQIAGRYIYRYIAPRLFSTVEGEIQHLTDSIKIIDEASGIGVERYLTLCLYDDYKMIAPEQKDKGSISPELMAAYLLDKVIEHIGKDVEMLPLPIRILNFTQTGRIHIKDVAWIKQKLYTTDLQEAYQAVLSYTEKG